MRKNLFLTLGLMLCALFCSHAAMAQRTAYGMVLSSDVTEDPGFYSFDAENPATGTILIKNYPFRGKPQTAAYAEGAYYVIGPNDGAAPCLLKTDLNAESYEPVSESIVGITFKDMTYDVSTQTMYAIGVAGDDCKLYTFNLTDGTYQEVATLASAQLTLASSKDGQLYCLSNTGVLNKLNKENGTLEEVGNVETDFDTMKSAPCMEFDHESGILYWSYTLDFTDGCLATVDPETAAVTSKNFKTNDQIMGLCFPEAAKAARWYAYQLFSSTRDEVYGMISFDPKDLTDIKEIGTFDTYSACPGIYVDGTYYAVGYSVGYGGTPYELISIDLETGKRTTLDKTNIKGMPMMWDMTYDYTTSTAYAISMEGDPDPQFPGALINTYSNLYTLDLKTYEWTKVTALGGNDYRGLACTLDGQLYAFAANGELHKVNKKTGVVEVLGQTGAVVDATNPGGMEFDHNTEELYFTYTSKAVATAVGSYLLKLNYEDGSVIESIQFPGQNQLVGLYIPFERSNAVPAAATEVTAVAAPQGELKATLTWVNPSVTTGGADLTAIEKVEIIRNDEVIATLDDQTPGSEGTHTDNAPINGFNNYLIKVYNAEGVSEAAGAFIFVGKDVPGKPKNVVLAAEGAKATLTWEAPAAGLNTGWFDAENVKYSIVRLPDNVEVAKDLTALKYEETIEEMNFYSYQVTAYTAEGEGGMETSNSAAVGNALPIPYECDFSTEEQVGLWIIGDEWKCDGLGLGDGIRGLIHDYNTEQSDSWCFSPFLTLKKGWIYTLNFDMRAELGSTYTESLEVTAGTEKTAEGQTIGILDLSEINNIKMETQEGTFTVPADGQYSIGFRCYTAPDQYVLQVTNVEVKGTDAIDNHSAANMLVYANEGRIYLSGEYTSAVVYNQVGTTVRTIAQPVESVDASNLAAGVYFVKVTNGDQTHTYKVMVK